jgi:DNA polymerase-3 subunit epsilon
MSRELIVVDIETTGLHANAHILEVGAINVNTGKELYFVPRVPDDAIKWAEPQALQINRYFERGVWKHTLDQENTLVQYRELEKMLSGNTFAGSNPTFDSQRLPIKPVWHHRLADLAAYAAGVFGLSPTELPGAHKVCELLGVTNESEHSALGDARAAAECFRRLQKMASDDS